MESNKNLFRWVLFGIVAVLCVILFCVFHDSRSAADAYGTDVTRTIQELKDESGTARTELNNARRELRHGQERADDAEKTAGRLQSRNEQSGAVVTDSQRLIGEIRAELADIDRTNGITETQTGNQEPAE